MDGGQSINRVTVANFMSTDGEGWELSPSTSLHRYRLRKHPHTVLLKASIFLYEESICSFLRIHHMYILQGQMLTLVEYILLLYRALLPTPVWYRFFLNKEYGSLFSSLTTGLYLTFKLTSLLDPLFLDHMSCFPGTCILLPFPTSDPFLPYLLDLLNDNRVQAFFAALKALSHKEVQYGSYATAEEAVTTKIFGCPILSALMTIASCITWIGYLTTLTSSIQVSILTMAVFSQSNLNSSICQLAFMQLSELDSTLNIISAAVFFFMGVPY
eukprot:Gb_03636 [translate_table: standard]